MSDYSDLEEFLALVGGDGWEVGDDAALVCPHGHRIELDGTCPDGCVSPLREAGAI